MHSLIVFLAVFQNTSELKVVEVASFYWCFTIHLVHLRCEKQLAFSH